MNLDDLRSVQRTERQKDSLQHLRDTFYEDVAAYVEDLKTQREQAAAEADDPFASPEVRQLTDEIETAEDVVEAIYERRVGKVVKLASFAAADMHVDEEGMTTQEHELFEDLVARIKENKTTVLDILSGEAPASTEQPETTAESPVGETDTAEPDVAADETPAATHPPEQAQPKADEGVLADAMGADSSTEEQDTPAAGVADSEPPELGDPEPSSDDAATVDPSAEPQPSGPTEPPSESEGERTAVEPDPTPPGLQDTMEESQAGKQAEKAGNTPDDTSTDGGQTDVERTMVRITQDVGEIFGVDDREYELATEDVVTLPSVNAEPLVERDAAERLE